jgi:hypothetical protein
VERARLHVVEAIELAVRLGAPAVVTVCGFGHEPVERPFERCLDWYRSLLPVARSRGRRLLVEPLSPRRCAHLTRPVEIERLLDELDAPDCVGTLLDTGHLLDGGHDPEIVLRGWRHAVDEVQLRGPLSTPPGPDLPLERWLAALDPAPAVWCIEHREPTTHEALAALVRRLRPLLAARDQGSSSTAR